MSTTKFMYRPYACAYVCMCEEVTGEGGTHLSLSPLLVLVLPRE